jgi:hypothetical protein
MWKRSEAPEPTLDRRYYCRMSEPFRDDFAAALEKASILEEENRVLKDELARARGTPFAPSAIPPHVTRPQHSPSAPVQCAPDAAPDSALERLERLSREIDTHDASNKAPPATVAAAAAPLGPRKVSLRASSPEPPTPRPVHKDMTPRLQVAETNMALERVESDNIALRVENASLRERLGVVKVSPGRAVFIGALAISFVLGYCAGHYP